MTDKYADLRAALDAGPKPGRWTWKQVGSFNTPGCAVFWPDTSKGGIHYRRLDSGGGMEQVDALPDDDDDDGGAQEQGGSDA